MRRFALVSREVFPFTGGGIGTYVAATAEALAALGEVTVFTTEARRELAEGAPALPQGVEVEFLPEPRADSLGGYCSALHRWSATAFEALKRAYPGGGPDLVEFPDYQGEGAVTTQARRTFDPAVRRSVICVRAHTTYELIAILNGALPVDLPTRFTYDLERYALENADVLLWAGGDILGTYRRFYGEDRLAPAELVRHPARFDPGLRSHEPGETVRLVYAGRLERRKGVQNLLRAVTGLERQNWTLTLVGGDTTTAPLGVSMRAQLELMAGGDPRIRFLDAVSSDALPSVLAEADVCVLPSRWECWPNVSLEALAVNRPVVAPPTGGLRELVREGESGWLTADASAAALADELERLIGDRSEIDRLIESGGPRQRWSRLTDVDEIREGYSKLVERSVPVPPAKPRDRPLVSVVVPYFELDRFVEDTVRSIVEQTYSPLEILVINDGSFRPEDRVLDELADLYPIRVITQANSGLGAARNLGWSQSRGRYVFPLDADNMAQPSFVERCVSALEHDERIAYVTSWADFVDEQGERFPDPDDGHRPLGNCAAALAEMNVAGDAAAVFRRSLFDEGFRYSPDAASYEDWLLYRILASAGHTGHVIPEPLLLYRVRSASMVRTVGLHRYERLIQELAASVREAEVRWTPDERQATETALERANADLRRVNANLARGYRGPADSAAASRLAGVEPPAANVEEVRVEDLDEALRRSVELVDDMQRTRVWRVAQRYWRAREALKGLRGGRSGRT